VTSSPRPETLREKQSRFLRLLPRLIDKAHELGFELTLGDGYRDPRVFGAMGERLGYGESKSAHKQRLAVDLNLFKDGRYLSGTQAHRPLGEFWESLGGAWGGRFNDGNHYSLAHNGIK
jgi:D-alanyl-D-alanine carboxypeptidase